MNLKLKALILGVGIALGIFGSAAGLLVSPQLAGIDREFRCVGCHGTIHSAVNLDTLPYNALVLLTGDVAKPGFVTVNDVFPYRTEGPKSIRLADFVKTYGGTTDFAQLVLVSTDGGRVTLDRQYVTDKSLLVPFLEGVRFTDENQHASTWLKGVSEVIVVGEERPVVVDGEKYTMGRLLSGPVSEVSTEAGKAMKSNLKTDEIFRGEYAHLIKGVPVGSLLRDKSATTLTVVDTAGRSAQVARDPVADSVLAIVDGKTTLVAPADSRRGWAFDVAEIRSGR